MHTIIDPPILYFGTPVVLISTENEDDTPNLAPMSSAWWLGHRCMLGLAAGSRTTENLQRTRECVLNLPSASLVENVAASPARPARTLFPPANIGGATATLATSSARPG